MQWSKEETDFLIKRVPNGDYENITKELNERFGTDRKIGTVRMKACRLGIKLDEESKREMYKNQGKAKRSPNGSLNVWNGYTFIRTNNGWESYSKYLYEKEHGKVPKNHTVCFRDSNTQNFNSDNLVCMPDKWFQKMKYEGWFGELFDVGLKWCELHSKLI